jgi:hypothetical protein
VEKGEKAQSGGSLLSNPTAVGFGVVVIFAGVAGLSFLYPGAVLIYMLMCFLLGSCVGIWLLIEAFRESVMTGVLSIVLGPLYQIYWLMTRCENAMLKSLWLANMFAVVGVIVLAATGAFENLPGQT